MRSVGRTNEGKYLVEMNEDEYKEFSRLNEAVTGGSEFGDFRFDHTRMFDFDFANVFHVIRTFYTAQFKVNDLQSFLDDIKAKLK